jgi:hypothetical protein
LSGHSTINDDDSDRIAALIAQTRELAHITKNIAAEASRAAFQQRKELARETVVKCDRSATEYDGPKEAQATIGRQVVSAKPANRNGQHL